VEKRRIEPGSQDTTQIDGLCSSSLIQSHAVARPFRRWESFLDRLVDDEVDQRVDRLDVLVNEYGYDRWGASPAAAKRTLSLVRWLYRHYFRVETHGLERVPQGAVLLISR
jgi:hypothetical protein